MTGTLEIRLFGGVQIWLDGKAVSTFISNKVPALLAYLVVTKRAFQRDTLAGLLWGEMPDENAKNNLRQALSNLRKYLAPYLLIDRDTVQFNQEVPYYLDVDDFLQGVQAKPVSGGPEKALALYVGDFLQGFFVQEAPDFEEWVSKQRLYLHEMALGAMNNQTLWYQQQGQYAQAIQMANRLLAFDPWREVTHRQLMLLYVRNGQRSAALAQYEHCRRMLDRELGVEPAPETVALYERIRAARELFPNNLMLQPTPFVGRAQELEQINELLLRPERRLITLLGPGGIGKSRLSVQVARRALTQGLFLNGVFFVALDGIEDYNLIPTAIANSCGLTFSGNQTPKVQVVNFLKNREMLLVLDNLEHLLDGIPWLIQLLQQAPHLRLLVTSRERLDVQWEWVVPIEGLDYPSQESSPAQARQSGAVQLFMDRAQAARPDFALTDQTLPPILAICRLVSGMPLALELAAASLRHYSCAEIEQAIAQNFDFLTVNFRDLPTRQRSLRAVFDYSWRLLSRPEQTVFANLSLFRGGFTLPAGQQVAEATPPILASLLDKSLLRQDKSGRYYLHEMLRQFALEKLADNSPKVGQRHSHYFATFTQEQGKKIFSPQQPHILNQIAEEIDNIRLAWDWALTHEPLTQLPLFINGLFAYYEIRAWIQEGVEQFSKALTAIENESVADNPLIKLTLLNRQARFLYRMGERTASEEALRQSLALTDEAKFTTETALTYNYLGLLKQADGDYEEAIQKYQQSLALYRQTNDLDGTVRTLNNLGVILLWEGQLEEAESYLQEGLTLRQTLGDPKGSADMLNNLAILLHEKKEFSRETQLLTEALQIYRTLDDQKGISTCLHNLSGVYLALADYAAARQFMEEALHFGFP